MSNEKMRQEFEAWYLLEYFENDKDCGLEWLSTEPCGSYRYELPSRYWKIWQASRAAITVDLPALENFKNDESAYYMLVMCRSCTKAAGLKVTP